MKNIRRGQLQEAEDILRRALIIEPYNESACSNLLTLLITQGSRSQAVRLYNNFKKRYEEDLGIKIDPRITEQIRQLVIESK